MLPSDDLRHALLEAMKQVEVLCVNFGFQPVEDLRRLVTNIVRKASDSKKVNTLPDSMFLNDMPYAIFAYAPLKEQFKQKYIQLIKSRVIPAIQKYYNVHPSIDLRIFEPVINIRVTPVTALGKLAMGETVRIVAENNTWNNENLSFHIQKSLVAWKQGRPISTNLTTNQARELIVKENASKVDFLIDGFPESLPKEVVDRDLRTAFQRVQNIIKNTPYKSEDAWKNRVVKGDTFPLSFVITIMK
jgi:hypothetical protein